MYKPLNMFQYYQQTKGIIMINESNNATGFSKKRINRILLPIVLWNIQYENMNFENI